MPRLLLIDNYDSFTYNLVQYFQQLGTEVIVKRNDEITVAEAQDLSPDYLVFSPGPGTCEVAEDIGVSEALFHTFRSQIPILGVCLGHQLMGKIFGGTIKRVEPAHGKRYPIRVTKTDSLLFQNLPEVFEVMRYHSLVVDSFQDLETTAVTDDDAQLIMALEKADEMIYGVQFHPESIGTPHGMQILENFLAVV